MRRYLDKSSSSRLSLGKCSNFELVLAEIDCFPKDLIFGRLRQAEFLFQVSKSFMKREIEGKLDKANKIAAAVALTVIAGAADVKNDAASWTSTHSLAYLDWLEWIDWQGGPCLPKSGTRQRPPIMAGYGRLVRWRLGLVPSVLGLSRRLRLGPFLFLPLEDNRPTERKRPHLTLRKGWEYHSLWSRNGILAG